MKTKIFTLFTLSVFALVMLAGFASADVDFWDETLDVDLPSVSKTVEQGNAVTVSFRVDEDDLGPLTGITFDAPITMTLGATTDTFDSATTVTGAITSLLQDATSTVMSLTFTIPEFQTAGVYDGILTINSTELHTDTLPITLTVTEATRPEEVNTCAVTRSAAGTINDDLQLTIEDVIVTGFGGDEDFEWASFDEIEIELEIENDNNDYKIEDITIGWGLYNVDTEEWYVDDEENDFNLKDGEKDSVFLTLNLEDDIDELAEGDYEFHVWANAKLDDGSDTELCSSLFEEVTIMDENDFVILDNIKVVETIAACGTSVQVTADIWNVGSSNQEEILVRIYNSELGIDERITIDEIDAYKDEELDVLVSIPTDVEEKTYFIELSVFDDYGDLFQSSNDDETEFDVELTVEGNCVNEPKATVSAGLESEAKAGKDLVVKATITNTGLETSTFDISVDDYNDWASFGGLDFSSVTLDAGESAEVLVTLNIDSGVSGDQSFNILVTEDGKVLSKPIVVKNIAAKSGFGFSGNVISEGSWPIWTIGAINVVLIVVIIFVALKVAKK